MPSAFRFTTSISIPLSTSWQPDGLNKLARLFHLVPRCREWLAGQQNMASCVWEAGNERDGGQAWQFVSTVLQKLWREVAVSTQALEMQSLAKTAAHLRSGRRSRRQRCGCVTAVSEALSGSCTAARTQFSWLQIHPLPKFWLTAGVSQRTLMQHL